MISQVNIILTGKIKKKTAIRKVNEMSGHSKFANIKHKKEKNDSAKGKSLQSLGEKLL
jgi:hypothetical protein